jgi:tRNA-splicing ligase RtcB
MEAMIVGMCCGTWYGVDLYAPRHKAVLRLYLGDHREPKLNLCGAKPPGALGGGNHFIEVCLDESESVWFLLHSGSRGVGNRLRHVFHRTGEERYAPVDDQPGRLGPRVPAAGHRALRGLRGTISRLLL